MYGTGQNENVFIVSLFGALHFSTPLLVLLRVFFLVVVTHLWCHSEEVQLWILLDSLFLEKFCHLNYHLNYFFVLLSVKFQVRVSRFKRTQPYILQMFECSKLIFYWVVMSLKRSRIASNVFLWVKLLCCFLHWRSVILFPSFEGNKSLHYRNDPVATHSIFWNPLFRYPHEWLCQ